MPGDQFQQLVANLKLDGVLTSAPLVYCPESRPDWSCPWPDGTVLSGNHRVEAAIEADIFEADCIEILDPITEERAKAIQLSHNAIDGQDDPNLLAELYAELDIQWKQYSGLADDVLKGLKPIDINSLGVKGPSYEELTIYFLPEQEEVFRQALKIITKRAEKDRAALVAHYSDFDKLFDSLIAVKNIKNIQNSAVAIAVMAELARQKVEELAARGEETEA